MRSVSRPFLLTAEELFQMWKITNISTNESFYEEIDHYILKCLFHIYRNSLNSSNHLVICFMIKENIPKTFDF